MAGFDLYISYLKARIGIVVLYLPILRPYGTPEEFNLSGQQLFKKLVEEIIPKEALALVLDDISKVPLGT